MSELRWTTESPKSPGLFLWRKNRSAWIGDWALLRFENLAGKLAWESSTGHKGFNKAIAQNGEWAGPILEPQEGT